MIEITSSETRSVKEIVASISGVTSVNMYGDRLHVALKAREIGPKVLETLRARGMVIEGEREVTPSLEDVFIARLKKEQ
jgi:hypothetical protein